MFKYFPLNGTRWMQCRWVQSPQDQGSLNKDFSCLYVHMGWGKGDEESLRMKRYWVKVENNASAKAFIRRPSTNGTWDGNAYICLRMVGLSKKDWAFDWNSLQKLQCTLCTSRLLWGRQILTMVSAKEI